MYFDIALIAYIIDKFIGEFPIKHPVSLMGDFIKWYEKYLYFDSVRSGAWLVIILLNIVLLISNVIVEISTMLGEYGVILLGIVASTTIASKMLYDSVLEVINSDNKIEKISMLVSRDTKNMTNNDINKASIETYSENLSDGVIAPLFYLILFGIKGALIYKAINTLDSMVGYRDAKYEKFGKFSAIIDDMANFLPSKITALIIALLFFSKKSFFAIFKYGHLHDSPNAGYPISAMAGAVGVRLGGDTSYFGTIKHKPHFGDGKDDISSEDVQKALSIKPRLDLFVIVILIIGMVFL